MIPKSLLNEIVDNERVGLVVIHRNLFQNDLLFHIKLVRWQIGAHHIAENFDRIRRPITLHPMKIGCTLPPGIGIPHSAQIIDIERKLPPVAPGRPLETHVFEKM